jgi:hypothetical protein
MMVNGEIGSTFGYSIPPFGSTRLVTANTASSVRIGSVRISTATQGAVPRGLAIFSYNVLGTTVSEASVPLAEAGHAFETYVENSVTEQIQTGLAMSNPSPSPVTVNLELATLEGEPAGLFGSVQLPANGQMSTFLNELFPSIPAAFQGVLRVSAPSPVAVIGLRGRYNERGDFLITTIPVSNDGTLFATPYETIFPHIVSGAGYTTQFVLFGSGPDGSASGTMLFLGKDGSPWIPILSQ